MKKKKLTIIDYGAGNLSNVIKVCNFVGFDAIVSSYKEDILNADALILPGVGAFKEAKENLEKKGLVTPILNFINSNKPFVGICLGYQLLMDYSTEFDITEGLKVFSGSVHSIREFENFNNDIKVPHVGWNTVEFFSRTDRYHKVMTVGLEKNEKFYFSNSFVVQCTEKNNWAGKTKYHGLEFDSMVQNNKTIAVQFHPELSGASGLQFMKNFHSLACMEDAIND